MADKKIDIKIGTSYDNKGIEEAKQGISSVKKLQAELADEAKVKFNATSLIMAGLSGNVKGVAIQMAALLAKLKGVALSVSSLTGIGLLFTGISLAVSKVTSAIQKQREETEKAAEEVRKNYAESVKAQIKSLTEGYNTEIDAINKSVKAKMSELDANQKLIESEIKLKKAKEGASAEDTKKAIEKSRRENAASKAAMEIAAGGNADDVRKRYLAEAKESVSRYAEQAASYSSQAAEKIEAKRKSITESYTTSRYWNTLHNLESEDGQEWLKRRVDRELAKWKKDNKSELYASEISTALQGMKDAENAAKKIEEEIAAAELERSNNQKIRLAEEKLSQADEIAAIDKIHQKRMQDIKSENSERLSLQKSELQQKISSAQSEFDRAFAMYRDPELAKRQIEEERDYLADYKQLQKDASRYDVRERIDTLASLMARGDIQGQTDQLEEWRKDQKFSPEVEAMVRSAAADETRTSAEDELRQINENTSKLAEKIDQLLSVK